MAQVTSFRDKSSKLVNTGLQHRQFKLALVNGSANNGDNIEVRKFALEPSRIHRVSVRASASLGAGATIAAQINNAGTRTSLTGATTAGGASKVDSDASANAPYDLVGGETLELVVGGANITSAATVLVDVYSSPRP
jgi:hypothetical protein